MFGLNSDLFYIPSFYAHTLNGILLLAAFVVLYRNFSYIKNVDKYRLITLILLFSSAAGIHSLSHLGLESVYGFNPLNQK